MESLGLTVPIKGKKSLQCWEFIKRYCLCSYPTAVVRMASHIPLGHDLR